MRELVGQRDEQIRQRDLIVGQRDRQLDKLDKNVTRYAANAQSIFIQGAVTGLIVSFVFVLGLKLLDVL
ncbi:MAG: hypothetical protein R3E89_09075 [Thiolinea sp.]